MEAAQASHRLQDTQDRNIRGEEGEIHAFMATMKIRKEGRKEGEMEGWSILPQIHRRN
jgi:hypothetical protein